MSAGAPIVIEYASSESGAAIDPGLVSAATPMLWTAILSGGCVAVCFGSFGQVPMMSVLHLFIYAAILIIATIAGKRFFVPGAGLRTALDLVACMGLIGIMFAPLLAPVFQEQNENRGIMPLGVCFLLMAITTTRHLLLYRSIAGVLQLADRRGLARSFLVMGWVKMIYEGLWLMCCALPLMMYQDRSMGREEDVAVFLAFGALFGCFGFGLIWIWMIISHTMLVATVKRQGRAIVTAVAQPVMAVS